MKPMDLIIIVIWILSSIRGYQKGFILSLCSLASYILAFIVAKRYYSLLAEHIIKAPFILPAIRDFITRKSGPHLSQALGQQEMGEAFPYGFLLGKTPIEVYGGQIIEGFKGHIIELLAESFINIISMILLFLLVRCIILLFGILLNKVFKLPGLNMANSLAGGVLGFIRGSIFIVIFFFIMSSIAAVNVQGSVARAMQDSIIFPRLYRYFLYYLLQWLG